MNQRLAIIILLWQLTGIYGKLELSSDKGGKGLGEWVVTETEKIRRGWRASANFFFFRVLEAESSSQIKYRDPGTTGPREQECNGAVTAFRIEQDKIWRSESGTNGINGLATNQSGKKAVRSTCKSSFNWIHNGRGV